MVKHRGDSKTMDLLTWEPPKVAVGFEADKVRAATLQARFCRAMSTALRECGKPREQVAQEMADYLGEASFSKSMLDAYVSEARDTHTISIHRYAALVHATRDYRLLSVLAEVFGLAVIDAKYLPAIEEAILADKIEELTSRRALARRRWKGGV